MANQGYNFGINIQVNGAKSTEDAVHKVDAQFKELERELRKVGAASPFSKAIGEAKKAKQAMDDVTKQAKTLAELQDKLNAQTLAKAKKSDADRLASAKNLANGLNSLLSKHGMGAAMNTLAHQKAQAQAQADGRAAQEARQKAIDDKRWNRMVARTDFQNALIAAKADAGNVSLQMRHTATAFGDLRRSILKGGFGAAMDRVSLAAEGLSHAMHVQQDKMKGLHFFAQSAMVNGAIGAGAGAAGVGGFFKMAMTAGEAQAKGRGIAAMLPPGTSKDFLEQLKQFDLRSPVTDYKQTVELAQRQLGAGFKPDELVNAEKTGLFDRIGNAVAAMGGNQENMNAVFVQLAQARSAPTITMRDIRAMTESGGLPMTKILEEGLGKERFAKAVSGEKSLTSEEFMQGFKKGLDLPEFKGGMERVMATLPGQVSNLESELYRLSVTIGTSVLPTMTKAVSGITSLAEAMQKMPDWVANVGLWGAAILAVGGGMLFATGVMAQSIIAIKALADMHIFAKAAALTQAWATRLTGNASLGAALNIGVLAAALISIAAIAYGVYVTINGTRAAAKMSNEELLKSWGEWGKIWISISEFIAGISDKIRHIVDKAKGFLGIGNDNSDEGLNKRLYETEMERRRKFGRGDANESFESWMAKRAAKERQISDGDKESVEENTAALDSNTEATAALFKEVQQARSAAAADAAGGTSSAPLGMAINTEGLGVDEIRQMQREAMLLDNKDPRKKALRLAIFDARTEQMEARAQEREERAAEREKKRQFREGVAQLRADAKKQRELANEVKRNRLQQAKDEYEAETDRIRDLKQLGALSGAELENARENAKDVYESKVRQIQDESRRFTKGIASQLEAGREALQKATGSSTEDMIASQVALGRQLTAGPGGGAGSGSGTPQSFMANLGRALNFANAFSEARGWVSKMNIQDAGRIIAQKSSLVEQRGGFTNEVEAAAYQKAYEADSRSKLPLQAYVKVAVQEMFDGGIKLNLQSDGAVLYPQSRTSAMNGWK